MAASLIGAALMLTMALPGCGSPDFHHPVYPAGGTVTYQGKPVVDAVVTFHPVDASTIKMPEGRKGPEIANPSIRTEAGGKFTLSTYFADDGMPAGDYRVTIVWAPQTLAVQAGETTEGDEEKSPFQVNREKNDKLNGRYAHVGTTTLRATAKPGDPNQFTFELN